MNTNHELIEMLRNVISGPSRGEDVVRKLEEIILRDFPEADDDERFEQLLHIIASYSPEGGEFMYGAGALAKECDNVLSLLQKNEPTGQPWCGEDPACQKTKSVGAALFTVFTRLLSLGAVSLRCTTPSPCYALRRLRTFYSCKR